MCYFSRLTAASRQELTLRNCLRAQGPTQLRLCAAGLNGGLRGPAQVTGGAVREKGQRLGDHELRRRARDSLPGNGRRGLSAAPNWHKLVKASVLIYTETGSQPGLGLGWSPVSV